MLSITDLKDFIDLDHETVQIEPRCRRIPDLLEVQVQLHRKRVSDDDLVPVQHRVVEHLLAGEVVVDRGPGQIGPGRDGLEGGRVVAQLGENLARRPQDSFPGVCGLRCWGAARSTFPGLRHPTSVP